MIRIPRLRYARFSIRPFECRDICNTPTRARPTCDFHPRMPPTMRDALFALSGKTALVTGASRGIGAATAGLLAALGAHVIVSSRRADACEEVVAQIRAAGGSAEALAAHIGEIAAIDAL